MQGPFVRHALIPLAVTMLIITAGCSSSTPASAGPAMTGGDSTLPSAPSADASSSGDTTESNASDFSPSPVDLSAMEQQGPTWFLGKLFVCQPHAPQGDFPAFSDSGNTLFKPPMAYAEMAEWRFSLDFSQSAVQTNSAGTQSVSLTFSATIPGATDWAGAQLDTMPAQTAQANLNVNSALNSGSGQWSVGQVPTLIMFPPDIRQYSGSDFLSPFVTCDSQSCQSDSVGALQLNLIENPVSQYPNQDTQHLYMDIAYSTTQGDVPDSLASIDSTLGPHAEVLAWCQWS